MPGGRRGGSTPRTRETARGSALGRFLRASAARFTLLVFATMIGVLTLVLTLPASSGTGSWTPLPDALFTAVSTISVTGLRVVDMATHWSTLGDVAILIGFQVGGIGVLTLASMLGLAVSRRLGLRWRLLAAGESDPSRLHAGLATEGQAVRLGEVGGLLATVAISVFAIELALTALLVPRLLIHGTAPVDALWQSFYLAASAFTNTGFTPTTEGISPFSRDPWLLGVLGTGVFLGSLGFPVIFVLARRLRHRMRLTVHARLTLVTTGALAVAGGLAILALEWSNPATLGAQEVPERLLTAGFMSLMARSGGFATVDVGSMSGVSLLAVDMLMFVGGGSASTAGGIKVTTLAVLFLASVAEARGDRDVTVFERRIPHDVLRLAVSVTLWGASVVAAASLALLAITGAPLDRVLFEVISAFGTSGLSTGLTETLPDAGKHVLAATMFAGRVGTVTLAAALAASQRTRLFSRPEERPIVG